jgi:transcriptional regulator with XRE-family HTH domain
MKLKPMDIGKLMTARRKEAGLNQRQMARQLGVSQMTVARLEKGSIQPTTVRVINWLLNGEDSINEMWRKRALIAEATIKDILDATREYREASQLRNGGHLSNGGRPVR